MNEKIEQASDGGAAVLNAKLGLKVGDKCLEELKDLEKALLIVET